MRRLAFLLLLLCAAPAGAADLMDRVQIPRRQSQGPDGRPIYLASLAPYTGRLPLFQITPAGGGGGGSSIASGSTPITGGADTQVCFNDTATLSCGDSGLVYNKTTDTLTSGLYRAGAGTASSVAYGLEADTGFILPAADRLGIVANGATVGGSIAEFNFALGLVMKSDYFISWSANTPGVTADSGLARQAAGVLRVSNGSSGDGQLTLETTGHRIASNNVTLTEGGAAETVITIVNATTQTFGLELNYRVTVTDATNRATREGSLKLVCDNAAGTVTCTKDATAQTDDESVLIATGGATLTYAIAADVATANTAKITFDIDSSLVVSAASITWTATLNGPGSIT